MIIIRLIGGLGNQMFQYATAKNIAKINNTKLKIDVSQLGVEHNKNKKITYRDYYLGSFNILEDFATKEDIDKIKNKEYFYKKTILHKIVGKMIPYYRHSLVKQRTRNFDKNIFKIKDNSYLTGYWQTEKNFKDIEDVIRKNFTLKEPLDAKNQEIANEIKKEEDSISLHIRRGDYVTIGQFINLDYYKNAINKILSKTSSPHFFIFSDDIDWVQKNLKVDYPKTFIRNNTEECYKDIVLMTLCKHHIIANSTFSWWGAWLNPYPNKIIIAPKRWFNDEEKNKETIDIIPKTWIKI